MKSIMTEFALSEYEALEVCKEVFIRLHERGLSDAETYAICCLLPALAANTLSIPEKPTIKLIRGSFSLVASRQS
jgi:hypothetical protein